MQVRHPGVGVLMERDFTLMRRGAALLSALPLVGSPQVKESVMQFGAPLREQLDLVTEAAHLDAFSRNFRHWSGVTFPQVGARGGTGPEWDGMGCGGQHVLPSWLARCMPPAPATSRPLAAAHRRPSLPCSLPPPIPPARAPCSPPTRRW